MVQLLSYKGLKILDWDEFLGFPRVTIERHKIYYRGISLNKSVNFSSKFEEGRGQKAEGRRIN
ncbi:MAG: hypothetical protein QNJ38_14970 [Prochloraceae cyanobacterium]|nr:hypothetical protein [Prochloraceae cyanobacterium]